MAKFRVCITIFLSKTLANWRIFPRGWCFDTQLTPWIPLSIALLDNKIYETLQLRTKLLVKIYSYSVEMHFITDFFFLHKFLSQGKMRKKINSPQITCATLNMTFRVFLYRIYVLTSLLQFHTIILSMKKFMAN